MISDPDVEALLNHYPFVSCSIWKEKLMKEICIDINIDKPTKAQAMRLASVIKKYNGGQLPRQSNGLKYHKVPDKYAIMQAQNAKSRTISSGTISAVL
jgi:restriction endonuclease